MTRKKFETLNTENLKIKGEIFKPEGKGKFPSIIFLHGLTGTYREGKNKVIIEDLARAGFLVVGFDFTHEALSISEGDFKDLTITQEVNDAFSVLKFIKDNLSVVDIERIGLIGHSMGGVIACIVASKEPNFKSLAILSTVWDPKKETPGHLETTPEIWEKQGWVIFPPDWEIGDKKLGFSFYKSLLTYEPLEVVPKITQPTLVLHGEIDDIVPINDSKKYYETLKSVKKLVIIKKGDHIFSNPQSLKEATEVIGKWFLKTL
jgi:pimeloyl-ACP methyl ester carboxylesterase